MNYLILIAAWVVMLSIIYGVFQKRRIDRLEKRFADLDAKVDDWILKIIKGL